MWFWVSFALLGLIAYMPISGFFLLAIALPLNNWLKKIGKNGLAEFSSYLLVFLCFIVAILAHGGLFGWYDKIEKPDEIIVSVGTEVRNDFYKYEERDDKIYLTVSDKNFAEYNKSHLMNNGNIHFDIKNANAKKDKANLKWLVEIDGKQYERNTLPAGTEIRIFADDFSLKDGMNIVKVTARNDLGETTRTIIVNRLITEKECSKSENTEVPLCQKLITANLADSKKRKAEEEAKSVKNQGRASTPVYNYAPSTLDGTTDTKNCSYVKYGKCWDSVLEEADNDGARDAYLNEDGYFGNPNYQGCKGVCADIYEDVYWKSYDNYQMTH